MKGMFGMGIIAYRYMKKALSVQPQTPTRAIVTDKIA